MPKSNIIQRLFKARANLLEKHPFFGRLLLGLNFGLAECGTAYTDMRNIVFDPAFAGRLSDKELQFVLLHEVYHCVLKHCTRGKTLRQHLYNIACDIVVNSCIMETLCVSEFYVDGSPAIHIAPDGKEGREYTAEEIYHMLFTASPEQIEEQYGSSGFDTHIIWERLMASGLEAIWDKAVADAAKSVGSGTGIPNGLQRYFNEIRHEPRNNWRQILHDFIQNTRCDYSFFVPDKRYQGDIIMPSFIENDACGSVENLWFLIDTSGSVSSDALAEAYEEIRQAADQIDYLSGKLSFFDTAVSEPVSFDSVPELMRIQPVGGGGTSFRSIFNALDLYFADENPCAILIITDGYATFPEEEASMNIPVIWIIVDSDIAPPWGEVIHISSK